MNFNPLESEADWNLACALRNGCVPDHPVTPDEMRDAAKRRASGGFAWRGLFGTNGALEGFGSVARAFWTEEPVFHLSIYPAKPVEGGPAVEPMFEALEEMAREQGALRTSWYGRDDLPWSVAAPLARGYEITQSNRALRLDLAAFQAPEVRECPILSYPELAHQRPDAWEHDVWQLEMDLMGDVPLPQPFKPTPFEMFRQTLHGPFSDVRGYFVAVDGDSLVGLSQLMPNRADPRIGVTALTGVRKEYRRKGVAKALKVRALSWARSHGIERIHTDTEEDNPMGQLNLQLGFVFDHEMIIMAKEL